MMRLTVLASFSLVRGFRIMVEHFGEGDEALEMLYKLDTDHKLKLRIMERIEELKKAGKDPSAIYTKEFFDELNNVK